MSADCSPFNIATSRDPSTAGSAPAAPLPSRELCATAQIALQEGFMRLFQKVKATWCPNMSKGALDALQVDVQLAEGIVAALEKSFESKRRFANQLHGGKCYMEELNRELSQLKAQHQGVKADLELLIAEQGSLDMSYETVRNGHHPQENPADHNNLEKGTNVKQDAIKKEKDRLTEEEKRINKEQSRLVNKLTVMAELIDRVSEEENSLEHDQQVLHDDRYRLAELQTMLKAAERRAAMRRRVCLHCQGSANRE
jgi:chromosome segregation ATPase